MDEQREPKLLTWDADEAVCFRKLRAIMETCGLVDSMTSNSDTTQMIAAVVTGNEDMLMSAIEHARSVDEETLEAVLTAASEIQKKSDLDAFMANWASIAPLLARSRKITQPYSMGFSTPYRAAQPITPGTLVRVQKHTGKVDPASFQIKIDYSDTVKALRDIELGRIIRPPKANDAESTDAE